MDLDKSNMKKLMFLITFSVLLLALFQHFSAVKDTLMFVIDVIMPFVIGLFIAFIVNVLMNGIETKLFSSLGKKNKQLRDKIKRPVSLVLSFAIIAGLVAFLILLLIPEVKRTSLIIAKDFPDYFKRTQVWLASIMERYNLSTESLSALEINWEKTQEFVTNTARKGGSTVFNTTLGITTSIFKFFFNFSLGIVFSIYVLLQKEKLANQLKKLLYAFFKSNKVDSFISVCSLSYKTFSSFVSGQCLEAVIIGSLCFAGMLIFRLPYAPLISALVGFTALIPVFGAFIGTGVGAFLILMVDPMKAFWFIIFILILQQFEGNLIYPKVVGKSVGLSGIWVLVAVTVGGSLLGVVGMLLSVPLASIVYSLLRTFTYARLKERNIKI